MIVTEVFGNQNLTIVVCVARRGAPGGYAEQML